MPKKVANFVLLTLATIAFLAGLSFWSQPVYDPDLGWHLFGGAYISNHHRVPTADLINSFSPRWHDYHWLAQVLLYQVFNSVSYLGLSVALGISIALFSVVLVLTVKPIAVRSPLITVVALLFMLALMAKVTSVRPQVLSLLLLALTIYRLRNKAAWYELPLLIFYAILAANIHVYWIFIPLLYLCYRVIPSCLEEKRSSYYQKILFFIVLCLAAFVSPYGIFHDANGWVFENYALLFDYLVMPDPLRASIGELQSSFASGGTAPLLLCAAVAVFFRGFKKQDLKAHRSGVLVTAIGFILAVRATKFLAIFGLFSFPYFLLCLVRVTRVLRTPRFIPGRRLSMAALVSIGIGAFVFAVYSFPRTMMVSEELNEYLPLKACSVIAQLPLTASSGRDHVRVLTHFNYGGWCRWIMYQEAPTKDLRVTTDGRTQWFPPEYFIKSLDLYNARFDWLKTLQEWKPDVILVPRDKPLANVLALAKGDWKLEYEDSSFAVFLPANR